MARQTKKQLRALTEDATNRAVRTVIQGLSIDVIVGVVLVVSAAFATSDGWSDFQWALLGFSIVKSIVQSVASFVMRRFVDASSIPTPLPPDPVPEPAD